MNNEEVFVRCGHVGLHSAELKALSVVAWREIRTLLWKHTRVNKLHLALPNGACVNAILLLNGDFETEFIKNFKPR